MADFKIAFGITNNNEGGYANDPDDHGGETFAGVSRNNFPNWSGWMLIDSYKQTHGTEGINSLLTDPQMRSFIENFYKVNFWNVNKLDYFNDQQIANNVYDFGVNSDTGRAAKALQLILKVQVDGIIGIGTLGALNASNAVTVYNDYNDWRRQFYINLSNQPRQAKFLKSWLSRLVPYQA